MRERPKKQWKIFKEMDRILSWGLIACTTGEAKNYVCNFETSGFKAWKQMVSHFDPRTGADSSVACSRVASGLTSARPNTLESARNTVQMWEQEAVFEMKDAK